jgi:hypothetical protein
MPRISQKPPRTLQKPGRNLWKWTISQFEVTGTEPLLTELCELRDRLEAVRVELRAKLDPRLISAEVKLVAQFTRCWKLLGLADVDVKPRPVGYPQGQPRQPRRIA